MARFRWLLTLIACLLYMIHSAAQPKVLKVGFVPFPPYNYLDKSGEAVGLSIDTVRQALASSGYGFEAKIFPAKRAYASIIRGELDMMSCMGRANFNHLGDNVDYSDVPVGTINLMVYYADQAHAINHIHQIKNKGVVIRRGYDYGGFINWIRASENSVTIQSVNSSVQGFRLLAANRKPYFLEYKRAADIALKHLSIDTLQSRSLSVLPHYLVFAKHLQNTKVQQKVEQALRAIVKNLPR